MTQYDCGQRREEEAKTDVDREAGEEKGRRGAKSEANAGPENNSEYETTLGTLFAAKPSRGSQHVGTETGARSTTYARQVS